MEPNIIHNINYHELAQEVKERKEQTPEASHKEIVSTILAEKGIQPRPQAPSPIVSTQSQEKQDDSVLPAYAQKEDPSIKNKVEHLVALTLQKGLEEGIGFAKKEDPFVIDTYHDALSDVLLEEMKKRKLI
jgi:hypothetical protein